MTPDYSGKLLADRYLLRRCIGLGGMATVYEAVDRELNKPVAVKILNPQYASQPDYLARFRQEAREAARIRHEHLVDVTDQGSSPEGIAFFVMEFLRGETLQGFLHPSDDESRPVSWRLMVAIVAQICDALQHAHEHGVIHRDIKPGNVFLMARRAGDFRVKVLDLGIAKVAQAHRDPKAPPTTRMSQGTPGTPEYMSPEQVLGGACSPQTDLYAVGVLMYRMLTGTLPFYSETSPYEVMDQHCKRAPEPPRTRAPSLQIPEAVEREVLRALAKRPEERHGSAQELADTLRALDAAESRRERLAEEDDEARTHQFQVAATRPRGLTRLLSYLAASLGGLTLSTTFFMVFVLLTLSGTRAAPPQKTFVKEAVAAPTEPTSVTTKPPEPAAIVAATSTPTDTVDDSTGSDGTTGNDGPPSPDMGSPIKPPPPKQETKIPLPPPPPSPPPTRADPEKLLKKFLGAQRGTLAKKCGNYKIFSSEKVPIRLELSTTGGPPTLLMVLGTGSKSPLGKCVDGVLRKLSFPPLAATSFKKIDVVF